MRLFLEIARKVIVLGILAVLSWAIWNFVVVSGLGIGCRCNNFFVWFILAVFEIIPIDLAYPEWISATKSVPITLLNAVVLGLLLAGYLIFC